MPSSFSMHLCLSSVAHANNPSRVKETLPEEVLQKMYAPAKAADVPVVEDPSVLEEFDGILFGIPTRY